MVDFIIVIAYFIIIFSIAISGRVNSKGSVEEYFLSNRSPGALCQNYCAGLRSPSIYEGGGVVVPA